MVASLWTLTISVLFMILHTTAVVAQKRTYGSASGVVAGKCNGQSCAAADIAGTTGKPPTQQVYGASASGWACLARYNPSGKAAYDKLAKSASPFFSPFADRMARRNHASITDGLSPINAAVHSIAALKGGNIMSRKLKSRQLFSKGVFKAKCTPNILIFAKATNEFGEYGETVGPQLRNMIKSGGGGDAVWTSVGVEYSNTADGNYCIGMPGGMIAKKLLESTSAKCPTSKIFMSGYSQGAMVVRIAVAYANNQARAQVKGLVTYGDPFNGAQIKGYNGPVKTFCKPTDAVCTGQFKIGAAHFSYAATSDVRTGANWLLNIAKGLPGETVVPSPH